MLLGLDYTSSIQFKAGENIVRYSLVILNTLHCMTQVKTVTCNIIPHNIEPCVVNGECFICHP